MKNKYCGFIEILYKDGTSDAFSASAGLLRKIGAELLKGDCLISIHRRDGKCTEIFSSTVNEVYIVIGPRIVLKRVSA